MHVTDEFLDEQFDEGVIAEESPDDGYVDDLEEQDDYDALDDEEEDT